MSEAAERLKAQAEDIIENFRSKPEDIAEFLRFKARLNLYAYSPRNTALIYAQNPNISFVASYKKWQDLGYNVIRKGGMKILAPAKATLFETEENGAKIWKRLSEATPAEKALVKAGGLKSVSKTVFVVGNVFDISQTNCPVEDYPKLFRLGYESEQHAELYEILKSFTEAQGIPVHEADMNSVLLHGAYYPATHHIEMNPMLNDTEKLSTLAHELGHAWMHNADNDSLQLTCIKECEADMMSMMIHSKLGLEVSDGRKSHFLTSYREASQIEDFSLTETLDNVCGEFKSIADGFEPYLQNLDMNRNMELNELAIEMG